VYIEIVIKPERRPVINSDYTDEILDVQFTSSNNIFSTGIDRAKYQNIF
jgi:hypothetical protein